MKANRQGKLILSVLVAGAVSMAGGVTAFAYEEPDKIINNTEYIMEDNVMITMEKMEIQEKEELVSDYFCVDNYVILISVIEKSVYIIMFRGHFIYTS